MDVDVTVTINIRGMKIELDLNEVDELRLKLEEIGNRFGGPRQIEYIPIAPHTPPIDPPWVNPWTNPTITYSVGTRSKAND